jgi:hypothetical protein
MDVFRLIDGIEAWLKKKLRNIKCAICGYEVVYSSLASIEWTGGHSPYIEIKGDEVITGYRCRKDPSTPIILYKFPIQIFEKK